MAGQRQVQYEKSQLFSGLIDIIEPIIPALRYFAMPCVNKVSEALCFPKRWF
jgi:hypothetical protein